MLRTLVVPLDGSELAERALPYAVKLASAASAEVVLVRVALAPPPARLDGADWAQLQREAVSEAESYLADVAPTIATHVAVKTNVLYGHVTQQLLELVGRGTVDGVVMATHGRTGLAHLLNGSVAEALLAESRVPVLLVHARPGQAPAAPFNPTTARVVVPLDGSRFAEAAIEVAADLVGSTGELVLVCVVQPPDHVERDERGRALAYLDQQEEARTREARAYLTHVSAEVKQQHPTIRVIQDIRIDEAASGIVRAAIDRAADLVVMATQGRTGLRRALVGSVAGGVLRNGSIPVMLVGPREAHRNAEKVSAHA